MPNFFNSGLSCNTMMKKMHTIRSTLLLALLLVSLSLASAVQQTPTITAASFCESNPADTWCSRAGIAWKYFQPGVGWNPRTGLSYDSSNFHYFTLWGLASYVLALVAAQQILPNSFGSYTFETRVDKILDFIDPALNPSFRDSTQVPYLVFNADTRAPDTGLRAHERCGLWPSAYLPVHTEELPDELGYSGYANYANRLNTLVTNQNIVAGVRALAHVGSDIYAYYVAQGFRLWPGFASQSTTETNFYNQVMNGPFVNPSLMYGVSGIPSGMQILSEVQLNAIMELNGIPEVTESPTNAWSALYTLAGRVMQVQWNRWAQTGKLTAWSEGALMYDNGNSWAPGFVYQNIVDPTKGTWVITDPSDQRVILWTQTSGGTGYNGYDTTHLPIVFTKVGLGFQAVYGDNAFTAALVSALGNKNDPNKGFKEGVWEGDLGFINGALNVQTNEAILSAAAYKLLKDFSITVTPQPGSSWTIVTGRQASFTVAASVSPAYYGHTITLQLSGAPSTYSYTPLTLSGAEIPAWTSTLTIHAGSTVGVYPVSISAVGDDAFSSVVSAQLSVVSFVPIASASNVIINGPANTVYFVFPDYDHTHAKPAGVGYAELSDWTAAGFLVGLTLNEQFYGTDTNQVWFDKTSGAPLMSNKAVVLFGGPLVSSSTEILRDELDDATPLDAYRRLDYRQ